MRCSVCGRCLALADRNGRHVASEAHYPRQDASGMMICSPPTRAGLGELTLDVDGRGSPGPTPRRLVTVHT
jgi:hypothetical protein